MRLALMVFVCSLGYSQDLLQPGKSASVEIPARGKRRLSVQCFGGDYFGAAITRQGPVDVAILGPDEILVRRFPGVDGSRRISFAADGGGSYTIELTNSSESPAKFEITLDARLPLAERLTPPPPADTPAIEALRKQILADTAGATEQFWMDIGRRGSPIVEPAGTDGKYHLVTFLFRGC